LDDTPVTQRGVMLRRSTGIEIPEGVNMQFILDKGVYKVTRITGPEHNFLEIRLADVGQKVDVVQLAAKNGGRRQIDRDDVLAQVCQGLLEANAELGKTYAISQVFLVASDTPSKSVYRYLTVELIRRIDSQVPFLIV
jgi:hypothetical protein